MSGYEARGWFDNNQFVISLNCLMCHGYAVNYSRYAAVLYLCGISMQTVSCGKWIIHILKRYKCWSSKLNGDDYDIHPWPVNTFFSTFNTFYGECSQSFIQLMQSFIISNRIAIIQMSWLWFFFLLFFSPRPSSSSSSFTDHLYFGHFLACSLQNPILIFATG